jgi:3-hydroxybutyryl-CoA dehydrogenase
MEIKKICVVGAGTMGSQIAQLAAQGGFPVSLRDVDDRLIETGLEVIRKNLSKYFVDKGKINETEAEDILARIRGTTDLEEAVDGAQVIIECVFEDMGLKQKVFEELDEMATPQAILASNTSALSITAIGSLTKRQDKVIGMHFFNPVPVMRLIEVIRGVKTSDGTFNTTLELAARFGKEVITVTDCPGFVTTRLLAVLANEAAKLVYEGIASIEDVDKACELALGHAMGPLKVLDMTNGLGIMLHTLEYLRAELGEQWRPCRLIKRKVLAGEIGVKAGKGFYEYGGAA